MDPPAAQCPAPTAEGTRCQLLRLNNSKHCHLHQPEAKRLYMRYHELNNVLERLDPTVILATEDTATILRLLSLTQKIYSARKQHQQYAFVDECFDIGHQYQYERLTTLISRCELRLAILFQVTPSENSEASSSSEKDELPTISDTDVRSKAIKIIESDSVELDNRQYLNQCISEAKAHLEQVDRLLQLLYKQVDSIVDSLIIVANDEERTYIRNVMLAFAAAYNRWLDNKSSSVILYHFPEIADIDVLTVNHETNLQHVKGLYSSTIVNKDELKYLLGDFVEFNLQDGDAINKYYKLSWCSADRRVKLRISKGSIFKDKHLVKKLDQRNIRKMLAKLNKDN